ncbi:hypothetical protein GA0074692_6779 [Micromonospora pallida]|uniref:Uncharacterized protein n=1 Tax=Micromonospora pallida TaxID=145854 RepID=A0A1C6TMZ8_9ACTN|nr:hypothetical protein [Micromonospora pallida]SCL43136.1 hypothetical protein GA0074692_6728 [Micromonospora pallida]SCL43234.1 hypothetical protein GA0074692_6779 [Micromonospora pallida]
MQLSQALDVIEALHRAAEHPDVTDITRYGRDTAPGGQSPAGVRIWYRSGSSTMLWGEVPHREAAPVPLPGEMPPPKLRAARGLMFAHHLLDFAQPDVFKSWELCSQPGTVVPVAAALRITARDGDVIYLRGTSACGPGGAGGEPEEDQYPDYHIPEGVREWHLKVNALSAGRA